MDYYQAFHYCKSIDVDLYEPSTQYKQAIITGLAIDLNLWGLYWVGGTDEKSEGDWVWESNGYANYFTDWAYYQPDGGSNENCLALDPQMAFKWNDKNCQVLAQPICFFASNWTMKGY